MNESMNEHAHNTNQSIGLISHPAILGFRTLFYACSPAESSFEEIEDVPKYIDNATPFFVSLIFLEMIVLRIKRMTHRGMRTNDTFASLSAGVVSQLPLLLTRNVELYSYAWVYNNWRLYELAWDSPATWALSMLGVDLGYYWVHRCAHEINFMWAGHQTHHSSESYNLTSALRQGVFQKYSSWIFYLPMALFIPPSVFAVHLQFNILYQFWIHTETIDRLGPLEYVLNTPSHHRVHHGINRYCIDKNYAGVLIIWDRMFGTFEAEKKEDEVVYGLVHQVNSWNPVYVQISHWLHIWKTAWNTNGFGNKLSVFVKGPGWQPGKPRLGLIEDIPDVHAPMPKYNKNVSLRLNIYCMAQLTFVLVLYEMLMRRRMIMPEGVMLSGVIMALWTLSNVGYLFESRSFAPKLEVVRCVVYLMADMYFRDTCALYAAIPYTIDVLRGVSITNIAIWIVYFVKRDEKTKSKSE